MMVSGTKMIRETSLVTNMEEKKTPKIRNREREAMRFRLPARLTSGRRTFSCLKPSSTHSIIRSVPRVRQSMFPTSSAEGGVMTIATAAASRDRVSIISFFRKPRTRFIIVTSSACLHDKPHIYTKSRAHCQALRDRQLQKCKLCKKVLDTLRNAGV